MPLLTCVHCGKIKKQKHSTAKYCNMNCFKRAIKAGMFTGKKHKGYKKGFIKVTKSGGKKYQKLNKKGFYIKNKDAYKDLIVDYENSPTGKAYIGINKKPFMPNPTGIGYQGVLIQDDSRQFVQCSSCGQWMKKITNSHLSFCSKGKITTTLEYKKQFGLNLEQGLVSDETSKYLGEAALKNKESITRKFVTKYQGKIYTGGNSNKRSRQFENRHGTCPAQIKERLKEFILVNQEFPSQHNRGRSLYKILIRRFGSFGEGLRFYGLPHFKRQGTRYKYTFADQTVFGFNINKIDQRKELMDLVFEKCKAFFIDNINQNGSIEIK